LRNVKYYRTHSKKEKRKKGKPNEIMTTSETLI